MQLFESRFEKYDLVIADELCKALHKMSLDAYPSVASPKKVSESLLTKVTRHIIIFKNLSGNLINKMLPDNDLSLLVCLVTQE